MVDIPLVPFKPDLGPYSGSSTTVATNVVPIENGFGPFPSTQALSAALGATCKGAWQVRSTAGNYFYFAATQVGLFRLLSTGAWDPVSRLAGGAYTGPDAGDLWTADLFGALFFVTNWNDNLQVFNLDTASDFIDVTGSPPRAKFVKSIGEFLLLGGLSIGATRYPRDWQHSAINDTTDWVVDGLPGSSDRQTIPSGEEIVGLLARPNSGARILQRHGKKTLVFTPGGPVAFEMREIDSKNGCFAPHSIVDIGGDDYLYITEQGIFRGDGHQPIGLDKYSETLIRTVDYAEIENIQGALDPRSMRVWWRATNKLTAQRYMFGYDIARDAFMQSDTMAEIITETVGVGQLIDSITGLVDDHHELVDDPSFAGGRVQLGAFVGQILYTFSGLPQQAVFETATTELNPDGGAFLHGLKLKTNASSWTVEVGTADLMDVPVSYDVPVSRDPSGFAPARADANFHRLRLTIPAGEDWTHAHGVVPRFKPSRRIAA